MRNRSVEVSDSERQIYIILAIKGKNLVVNFCIVMVDFFENSVSHLNSIDIKSQIGFQKAMYRHAFFYHLKILLKSGISSV